MIKVESRKDTKDNNRIIQNTFFIVRHGEARQLEHLDHIFTSPFRRTRETAEIFAKHSKCEIKEDARLREIDVGDFELCNYELTDAFAKNNEKHIPYPNGESFNEAKKRVIEFFDQTNQTYRGKKILIVTHGYPVQVILEYVVKNFDRDEHQKQYNCARRVFKISL